MKINRSVNKRKLSFKYNTINIVLENFSKSKSDPFDSHFRSKFIDYYFIAVVAQLKYSSR